jgi:hypothetical protein
MRRAWLAVLLCAACAPSIDLPQPTSPFDYTPRPSAIAPFDYTPRPSPTEPGPVAPGETAPCLQVTSRRHVGSWLWKHGALVSGPVDRALIGATSEDPRAHATAKSARAQWVAGGVLLGSFYALIVSAAGTAVGTIEPRQPTPPSTIAAVASLVALGVGAWSSALALFVHSPITRARAVDEYNDWAAQYGCPSAQN